MDAINQMVCSLNIEVGWNAYAETYFGSSKLVMVMMVMMVMMMVIVAPSPNCFFKN